MPKPNLNLFGIRDSFNALALFLLTQYRKGRLEDLSKFRLDEGLSVTAESLELNVVGMGHEFWLAIEGQKVIGIAVLGREDSIELRILHIEVAHSLKKEGVGSALLRSVIETYPRSEFTVIPFEGTEDFYARLGFVRSGRWEMRRASR